MPASRNPLTLAMLVSLWLASVGNWPLWRALSELPDLSSLHGMLFIASLGVMIACFGLALLALGAWRRSIRPLATLLLVVAAVGAHFMGAYRIVIDPTMMVNVLHTDVHEASDLVDWRLLLSMALIAGLPAWWLWRTPLQAMPAAAQGLHNTAALVLALSLAAGLVVLNAAPMASTMRNHKSLRYMVNPANSFYALGRLAFQRGSRPAGPAQAIDADAQLVAGRAGAKPPLLMQRHAVRAGAARADACADADVAAAADRSRHRRRAGLPAGAARPAAEPRPPVPHRAGTDGRGQRCAEAGAGFELGVPRWLKRS